jgi:predicted nucleic acid-binding protein
LAVSICCDLQFGRLWIPAAVAGELAALPYATGRAAIETAIAEQWIRVASAPSSGLLTILLSSLHRGEAEAIALAAELKASIVLMDEQEGRQTAARAGLAVTGVLGVLLRAKLLGEISSVQPEIRALHEKAHFFIAPSLEARVLSLAGE